MPKGQTSRPYNRKEKRAVATKSDLTAFKKKPSAANLMKGLSRMAKGPTMMSAQSTLTRRETKEVRRNTRRIAKK
jgi:hypothetical protein